MSSTYSDRYKLELQATGANSGTWGNNTNNNLQTVDAFTAGYLSKSVAGSANVTLTTANADPDAEASNKVIEFTGALSDNIHVFIPAVESNYIFFNNTSGSYTLKVVATGHAANAITITQGAHTIAYNNASNKMVDLFAGSLGTVRAISQVRIGDNIKLNANGVVQATTFRGSGSGISGVDEFPSGTKAMFVQTAAPTGFTKDTTSSLNDTTLRVVNGTGGGTGGAQNFSATFAAKNATGSLSADMSGLAGAPISATSGATTISTPTLAAHTHPYTARGPAQSVNSNHYGPNRQLATPGSGNSGSTGGGGSHTHPISGTVAFSGSAPAPASLSVPNMTLKFVDSIIASKD
tara:strand:+ start:2645 stop:3694 length:1050 start_codon:yes stop_codon:yes gene_type:complete